MGCVLTCLKKRTMADIEGEIKRIHAGNKVPVPDTLDLETKDHTKFIPRTKINICYICCSILFDDEGRTLLIQEAKQSCRNLWYLPAGRLEPGETIVNGAKREVLEESGLRCDLIGLVSVEVYGTWQRFTFTGNITGGTLKTIEQQDQESLQARFYSDKEIQTLRSSLRAGDVIKLIGAARKYYKRDQTILQNPVLPVIHPHRLLIHRVLIIDRSYYLRSPMHVLLCGQEYKHIPVVPMFPLSVLSKRKSASVGVSVFAFLRNAIIEAVPPSNFRICGVLGMEHEGTVEDDGICLTSLVCLDLEEKVPPPAVTSSNYCWFCIEDTDVKDYLHKATQGALVPFL